MHCGKNRDFEKKNTFSVVIIKSYVEVYSGLIRGVMSLEDWEGCKFPHKYVIALFHYQHMAIHYQHMGALKFHLKRGNIVPVYGHSLLLHFFRFHLNPMSCVWKCFQISTLQWNMYKATIELCCPSRQSVAHDKENKHDFVKITSGKLLNLCIVAKYPRSYYSGFAASSTLSGSTFSTCWSVCRFETNLWILKNHTTLITNFRI